MLAQDPLVVVRAVLTAPGGGLSVYWSQITVFLGILLVAAGLILGFIDHVTDQRQFRKQSVVVLEHRGLHQSVDNVSASACRAAPVSGTSSCSSRALPSQASRCRSMSGCRWRGQILTGASSHSSRPRRRAWGRLAAPSSSARQAGQKRVTEPVRNSVENASPRSSKRLPSRLRMVLCSTTLWS